MFAHMSGRKDHVRCIWTEFYDFEVKGGDFLEKYSAKMDQNLTVHLSILDLNYFQF